MYPMRVCILGIGDAFTTSSFGSSALIKAHDEYLLLDCPDPIHRVIRQGSEATGWNIDALGIHDILLTHLHGDHSNGLESFAFHRFIARRNDQAKTIPTVHTHLEATKRLWQKLAPAMDIASPQEGRHARLDDFFHMRTIEPNMPFQACDLTIEARMGDHPLPCCGFKITDPASGRTLGWSGDTMFDLDHINWLSSADIVIHDCNADPAHTDIDRLNTLPDNLRSKMRLIHTPDNFDESCTDIAMVREGEVLEL